ncbi:MAG: hypothetical protein HRT38_02345 [Alteromonadaceae bacterium]|nr:hypothetical protein [Alteromonadaceae bacterium]
MNIKFKKIGMLILTVALGGCSEPAVQQKIETSPTTTITAKAVNPADFTQPINSFTQPTRVPTTNTERQALLDSLNINADSPVDKRRLALFVRYTYFTDNKDRQLKTLEQLVKEIATMRKTRQDDHELTALYGSATSLQTVFFLDNLGKINFLSKKGSRYLDRAVKNAPNHLGVRLYRGITYAEMPAFLGKGRQAVEDFNLIKYATDAKIGDKFYAMTDYYHALALIKDQQKINGIKKLASLAGQNIAPWSERAATLLKEKS